MEVVNRKTPVQMQNKIKNIAIGTLILVVPGMVLIRSLTNNHFKPDAELHAIPSFNHSVVITCEQVEIMTGNKLVIDIDTEVNHLADLNASDTEELHSDATSLLSRMNRRKILNFKGNVFLFSDDPALSSGLWMVLSQMGRKNLFIVSDNIKPEVFKYEFRPDTLTRPEL